MIFAESNQGLFLLGIIVHGIWYERDGVIWFKEGRFHGVWAGLFEPMLPRFGSGDQGLFNMRLQDAELGTNIVQYSIVWRLGVEAYFRDTGTCFKTPGKSPKSIWNEYRDVCGFSFLNEDVSFEFTGV